MNLPHHFNPPPSAPGIGAGRETSPKRKDYITMTIHHERDLRRIARRLDQEARMREHIGRLLEEGHPITRETARLIAACIHSGDGSALERFAASDQLDTAAALAELTSIRVPSYQTGWVIALWTFLEVESDIEPLGALQTAPAAQEGW